MEPIEAVSIILSIVALVVTIIGFFASLKFYQSGVEQQKLTNETLAAVKEISRSIQNRVDGMFDKTLDAAIGRATEDFEALDEQLEDTTEAIIESAVEQVGEAGRKEREKLESVVGDQMRKLRERIDETRESAEEVIEATGHQLPQSRLQVEIIAHLYKNKSASIADLAENISMSESATTRAIERLQSRNLLQMSETDDTVSCSLTKAGKEVARITAAQAT